MITGQNRGNFIEYTDDKWVYSNDKTPLENEERPCTRCGRMPTLEGCDACLGHIEGATSACCGHGVQDKMVMFE